MQWNKNDYIERCLKISKSILRLVETEKGNHFDYFNCSTEVEDAITQSVKPIEQNINAGGNYLRSVEIENSLLTVDVENIDNENIYENIEKGELLKILKENLKVSEYKLFKMKFIEGLTNSEIADLIGKSKNSIEVRIVRLREKIKNILSLSLLRKGGITSTKT